MTRRLQHREHQQNNGEHTCDSGRNNHRGPLIPLVWIGPAHPVVAIRHGHGS